MARLLFTLPSGASAEVSATTPMPTGPGNPSTLQTLSSTLQNTSNTGTAFSTAGVASLAVDLNITAVAGTSPTLTAFVDRLGADGIWYRTWTSSALNGAGSTSVIIGPYPTATGVVTAMLTSQARLGWTIGGSAGPSVTFSLSVVGR